MEAEKSPFGGMKLFFIAYFALLMLALTFIGVMGSLGYEMVNPSAKFVLFGLLIGSAMIAGAIWIVRRIWRKWVKIAVGALLTVVILAVTVGMSLTFSLVLVAATLIGYAFDALGFTEGNIIAAHRPNHRQYEVRFYRLPKECCVREYNLS